MEEYSDKTVQKTIELVKELNSWIAFVQKGLTIEAENGFRNIHGRSEVFSSFVAREILSLKSALFSEAVYKKLNLLSKSFEDYPSKDISIKKRLVIDTRKYLEQLRKDNTIPVSISAPILRLSKLEDDNRISTTSSRSRLSINSQLVDVQGIGSKMVETLASLDLYTINDLLAYYPRDYVDYSALKRIGFLEEGQTATIVATIRRTNSYISPRNKNLSILDLQLEDNTGRIKITKFFIGKRFSHISFLKKQQSYYPKGAVVAVSGLVKSTNYGMSFTDPLIEILENKYSLVQSKSIGRLLPIYHLTEGLSAEKLRAFIRSVLYLARSFRDPLPIETIKSLALLSKQDAIKQIHQPNNSKSLAEAKRRLVFDEFFFLQLGLLKRRFELEKCKAPSLSICQETDGLVGRFLDLLPFSLTNSQAQVLQQIQSDLSLTKPMSRLVQGDVGSGKTVVAIASLLNAVESGWQGALMAPTEVLAQQHYLMLCQWLPHLHVTVELLTGSTPLKDRKRILNDLLAGNLKIIVGTHALLEDKISFLCLGLVVVDEQHRFGVNQRNILLNKGLNPHLLTMTATPIPRTLALSIHGDLDVSQINELPPGRTPIKTLLIQESQREDAYQVIKEEIELGHQAYVVLPLVEVSEKLELRSAIDVFHELSTKYLNNYSLGLLHGRMHSNDKKSIIKKFANKEIQVLVSTTVIEVGVDVSEATVMVIDHADRFGLAQLHQLRGRVGRGILSSKCILIDTAGTRTSKNRLEVLVNSTDGFEISETDLRLRGPGQVLGTRQSGLPDFALANLIDDEGILKSAREEAFKFLKKDPEMIQNSFLREMLDDYWDKVVSRSQLN